MPVIDFSTEDVLRDKIVTPGWYKVLITHVGQKPSSGSNPDTTTIWPLEGKIICNADNGSEEFAGVPTPAGWNFNDNPRAKGFMLGFFKALGVDVKPGERYDLSAAEGQQIEVFLINDTYEGRVQNKLEHKYRAVRAQ